MTSTPRANRRAISLEARIMATPPAAPVIAPSTSAQPRRPSPFGGRNVVTPEESTAEGSGGGGAPLDRPNQLVPRESSLGFGEATAPSCHGIVLTAEQNRCVRRRPQ